MPPKKIVAKKQPTFDSKNKKLKGGLISQDDDDDKDLIKESDDSIDGESSEESSMEETFDNVKDLNDEESDDDKLDDNKEIDNEDKDEEISDESEDETEGGDDKCLYDAVIKKKKNIDIDDDDLVIEDIGEEDNVNIKKVYIDKEDYISKKILSKYERVRILGIRTKNLSAGAKPMIKNIQGLTFREIAKLELKNKKMPFLIERQFADGTVEVWDVADLEVFN